MHVARVLGVTREQAFMRVLTGCGVDVECIADEHALSTAMAYLESLRPRHPSDAKSPRGGSAAPGHLA